MDLVRRPIYLAYGAMLIPLVTLVVRLHYGLSVWPSIRGLAGGVVAVAAISLISRTSQWWSQWLIMLTIALTLLWIDMNTVAHLLPLYALLPFGGVFHLDRRLAIFGGILATVFSLASLYWPLPDVRVGTVPLADRLTEAAFLGSILLVVLVGVSLVDMLLEREARLVKERQEHADELVQRMAELWAVGVDAKHPYTAGHSERVTAYAVVLARHVPSLDLDLHTFRLGGLLHDVGKIAVPDSILDKPGRLTEEEFRSIKSHTVRGHEMIRRTYGSGQIAAMTRFHHERWDGKGYPDGLAGEQIPLCARILAIADAFDAMTSSRAYRPAMSPQEAREQIVGHMKTQFDPHLLGAFEAVWPEWLDLHETMSRPAGS